MTPKQHWDYNRQEYCKLTKTFNCFIGIDPGVVTGFAIWMPDLNDFDSVFSTNITSAMQLIEVYHKQHDDKLHVIVEDARMIKKFSNHDFNPKKYQGVGSVKRDCAIWEEFLEGKGISYQLKKPRNTKIDTSTFNKITGWTSRTNNHARDAAMLVFKLK